MFLALTLDEVSRITMAFERYYSYPDEYQVRCNVLLAYDDLMTAYKGFIRGAYDYAVVELRLEALRTLLRRS